MSDETTGCADDGDALSLALRKIPQQRLNEILANELRPREEYREGDLEKFFGCYPDMLYPE